MAVVRKYQVCFDQGENIKLIHMDATGRYFLTLSSSSSTASVCVFSLPDLLRLETLQPEIPITLLDPDGLTQAGARPSHARFSPCSSALACAGQHLDEDGAQLVVYDLVRVSHASASAGSSSTSSTVSAGCRPRRWHPRWSWPRGAACGSKSPQRAGEGPGHITCVAWSHDGSRLAAACSDGRMRVYDAESGGLLWALEGHEREVLAVSWDAGGEYLTSRSAEDVRVWSLAGQRPQEVLLYREALAQGRLSVTVQDARTGRDVMSEPADTDKLFGVAPDGRTSVQADGEDITITLYDAVEVASPLPGGEAQAWPAEPGSHANIGGQAAAAVAAAAQQGPAGGAGGVHCGAQQPGQGPHPSAVEETQSWRKRPGLRKPGGRGATPKRMRFGACGQAHATEYSGAAEDKASEEECEAASPQASEHARVHEDIQFALARDPELRRRLLACQAEHAALLRQARAAAAAAQRQAAPPLPTGVPEVCAAVCSGLHHSWQGPDLRRVLGDLFGAYPKAGSDTLSMRSMLERHAGAADRAAAAALAAPGAVGAAAAVPVSGKPACESTANGLAGDGRPAAAGGRAPPGDAHGPAEDGKEELAGTVSGTDYKACADEDGEVDTQCVDGRRSPPESPQGGPSEAGAGAAPGQAPATSGSARTAAAEAAAPSTDTAQAPAAASGDISDGVDEVAAAARAAPAGGTAEAVPGAAAAAAPIVLRQFARRPRPVQAPATVPAKGAAAGPVAGPVAEDTAAGAVSLMDRLEVLASPAPSAVTALTADSTAVVLSDTDEDEVEMVPAGPKDTITTMRALKRRALAGQLPTKVATSARAPAVSLTCNAAMRALRAGGFVDDEGDKWANDEVIACGQELWSDEIEARGANVLAVDSLFVEKMLAEGGANVSFLARVAGAKKPCEYEEWVVPVNEDRAHWYLVHVRLPQRSMRVYDSFTGTRLSPHHKRITAQLKAYLAKPDSGSNAKGAWKVERVTDVARQADFDSCGYFTIEYGRRLCAGQAAEGEVRVGPVVRCLLERMLRYNAAEGARQR